MAKTRTETRILDQQFRPDGTLIRQIVEKKGWSGPPLALQKNINAFNFPYTLNPGSGCFFHCSYCFLRSRPFNQHITPGLNHGQEMNFKKGFVEKLIRWLDKNRNLPQYMKRVQMGVASEMYHPRIVEYYQPRRIFEAFRDHGPDWMVHLVTKSNQVIKDADLLAEMKHQVQIEVSLVTLDEDTYELFERGTPNPKARLKIIEELSRKGIFVRAMCMPVMRQYKVVKEVKEKKDGTVVESILPVYRHLPSGQEAAMHKVGQEGKGKGMRYFHMEDGHKFEVKDIREWEPIILRDYSKPQEMKKVVYDLGARAFKSKDLNYFYVEGLLEAKKEDREPTRQHGRFEDPNVEVLDKSGEWVLDPEGKPIEVKVGNFRVPKRDWVDGQPPMIRRKKMNYGYSEISGIDWVDCV